MKSLKPSCPNTGEPSIWREIKAYSLVVGNSGCEEDEGPACGNSDFSKPPAPSDLMNILLFAIISTGTMGHLALPATKLRLPPTWCFCTSLPDLLLVP